MTRSSTPWLRSFAGFFAAALLMAALTWSHPPRTDLFRLTVGTGGTGGVYHVYGAGLARIANNDQGADITAVTTAASVENIEKVAQGELDAAFTLADVAALSVSGDEPFAGPQPVAAIARLYDNHTHVVVRDDSPYEEVADLAGGVVSVGAAGSGTEMMAERLLDLAGLDEAPPDTAPTDDPATVTQLQLSIGASAEALDEGRIDAFIWSGGLPTHAVADLAERTPIRLLDLSEHVPELVDEYGEYFVDLPVPAGTYHGVPPVRTIGVPNLLIVNTGMPDRFAKELTRLLFDSRNELARIHPVALHLHSRSAISTLPVPLHPGAAEYYRSVKYAHDSDTTRVSLED